MVAGAGTASGWKFVEEVAVAGFDDGFVLVGARVWEGETGGVLDGEAAFGEKGSLLETRSWSRRRGALLGIYLLKR